MVVMATEKEAVFDYDEWVYVKPFAKSWKSKIKKRKHSDEKQYEFGRFIVNYIIYAALVNVIKPRDLRTRVDCAYCTKVVAYYIIESPTNVGHFIKSLTTPARKLGKAIKNNNFSVKSSKGVVPGLETKWKQGGDEVKLLALLQSLYYLRCNLFHSNKEYDDYQVELLNPTNECLKNLNRAIHQMFTKQES